MKRALRLRVAVLSACVIVFAQLAVAAQPWPLDAVAHRHAPVVATSDAPEPCAGHLTNADGSPARQSEAPSPNFCEVHCQDASQPDAMIVAIASPFVDAWLVVPASDTIAELRPTASPLAAKSASPPARLLFARFLN